MVIDQHGNFMLGKGRYKQRLNIYDYIPSLYDAMRLGEALNNVSWLKPERLQITFRHHDKISNYFCLLFKLRDRFLLKGWEIDKKELGYFPTPQIEHDEDDEE